ncbi:MAG: cytidylate kinase-like family protein [Clostridia bacterium]|nr:cytidylate kinase-like family protein [Clostridia bacterium]
MRIITISREFGSGGRELGKRMADELGYAYYDREIITAIAQKRGLDEKYVEHALDSSAAPQFSFTFRHSFAMPHVIQSPQTDLLLEQKKVIDSIAAAGKDCIIVGRNADVLLKEYKPMSIFVCADVAAKVQRCIERAEDGENLTEEDVIRNMRQIDKNRARTREILSGSKWGERTAYDLIINTTGWNIKKLAPAMAAFARSWFER